MMRQMKYILPAMMIAMLTGCNPGTQNDMVLSPEQSLPATLSREDTEENPETQTGKTALRESEAVVKTEPAGETAAAGGQEPESSYVSNILGEGRPMTASELAAAEVFINGRGENMYKNYGYLQSGYRSPVYADLSLILYTGAGIVRNDVTEEEMKDYLEVSGIEHADFVNLTAEQIDTFLRETAGIGLEEHKGHFSADYLPEYDSYYLTANDTNWCYYKCVSGVVTDGQYKVYCTTEASWSECLTTLRRAGSSYQFVSNQLLVSEGVEKGAYDMNHLIQSWASESGTGDANVPDFNSRIFDTDERFFTADELYAMNPYLLEVAVNEIYARHGYIFESNRFKQFFHQFSWYEGTHTWETFSEDVLNEYEKANRDLIESLEIWNNN